MTGVRKTQKANADIEMYAGLHILCRACGSVSSRPFLIGVGQCGVLVNAECLWGVFDVEPPNLTQNGTDRPRFMVASLADMEASIWIRFRWRFMEAHGASMPWETRRALMRQQ